ncbi:MAG: hypothetical protein KJ941_07525 [Bacteroidetes bacterium]|nr:hypothetical protein [Bacteroidota bacterium]
MDQPTLFFNIPEGQEAEEVYELTLFEDKTFFRSKPILSAIYQARIKKMELRKNAVIALFPHLEQKDVDFEVKVNDAFEGSLQDVFKSYLQGKNSLLLDCYKANSIASLVHTAEELLKYHQNFAEHLFLQLEVVDMGTDVLLSKETDAMEITKALKMLEKQNGFSVKDAFEMDYSGKEFLCLELNRLFLQHRKERMNEHI